MNTSRLKSLLHNKCLEYVEQRIANAQEAIHFVTESGNEETKSSAGDKHETGRAMAQLEQEKATKQLQEAHELKKSLLKIDINQHATSVSKGSLVLTDQGNFYISIAAGKILLDNVAYFAISPLSPIAIAFMGLKSNQKLKFNECIYSIEAVL